MLVKDILFYWAKWANFDHDFYDFHTQMHMLHNDCPTLTNANGIYRVGAPKDYTDATQNQFYIEYLWCDRRKLFYTENNFTLREASYSPYIGHVVKFLLDNSDRNDLYFYSWIALIAKQIITKYNASIFAHVDLVSEFTELFEDAARLCNFDVLRKPYPPNGRYIPKGILFTMPPYQKETQFDCADIAFMMFNEMQYIRGNFQMFRIIQPKDYDPFG